MQRGAFFCLWILFTFSLFAQNKENGSVACDSIVYKKYLQKSIEEIPQLQRLRHYLYQSQPIQLRPDARPFHQLRVLPVGNNDQRLRFSPNPHNKIGAYFGWRWIFLGWAVDTDWLYGKKKQEKSAVRSLISVFTVPNWESTFSIAAPETTIRYTRYPAFPTRFLQLFRRFQRIESKDEGIKSVLHFQQSTFLLSSRLQPVHQPALQCRFFHCRILRIHPQSELRLYQAARNHSGNHEPGYEGETYQIHEHQPQRRLCLQLGVCPQLPRMPVVQSGCRLQDITHREDRRAGSGRLVQEFQYRLHSACRCGIQQQQILRGYLIRRTDIRLLQKQFLPEQRVRHPPNICRIQLLSEKGAPEEQK